MAGGLLACKAETDLGQTCKMTRPSSDGGPPVEIDVPDGGFGDGGTFDVVALGSAECDDLVCIRTSGSQNPDNENGKLRGYCTASCIDSSSCEPDFEGKSGTMACEKLLVDQALIEANPEIFGSGASSMYCVKPRH
jgi:hypothetical protein